MNPQPINKDVTQEDLDLIFDSFDELNKKLSSLATEIFTNETEKNVLSKPSHFTFSIVHRAIELNRGFKTLAKANNWLTAINLIRLQQDNCMRLFALAQVEDRLDFYQRIVSGEHVRNIEDADGNKMTDSYLSKKLDALYPGFRMLYENISGFVHFSKEHIDFNNDKVEKDDSFLMYVRLSETTELPIHKKVDYAFNMFMTGKELSKLLGGYKLSMAEFMKKMN